MRMLQAEVTIMADILSQKEIDDLLSSNISGDSLGDMDDGGPADESPRPAGGGKGGGPKSFTIPKKKFEKFSFPYKTPVIKQHRFIYNPISDDVAPAGKIVVRSLENYAEYIKQKNAAAF